MVLCLLLVEAARDPMEEPFDLGAFEFPPRRRVVILHQDRLTRLELGDGEAGIAGVEPLERPENLDGWGVDSRRRRLGCFLLDPVEEHVVERPRGPGGQR